MIAGNGNGRNSSVSLALDRRRLASECSMVRNAAWGSVMDTIVTATYLQPEALLILVPCIAQKDLC